MEKTYFEGVLNRRKENELDRQTHQENTMRNEDNEEEENISLASLDL